MDASTVAKALSVSTAIALVFPLALSSSASAQGYGYSPPPNPTGVYTWEQSTWGPPNGTYNGPRYRGYGYSGSSHNPQPYGYNGAAGYPGEGAYYGQGYGPGPYAEEPYGTQAHTNQPTGAEPSVNRPVPGYRGEPYAEGPYGRQPHLNQPYGANEQPVFNYLRPPPRNQWTQTHGSSYMPRGRMEYGRGRFVVATGGLNLRSGPNDAAPVRTSLPGGTPVMGPEVGGWWRVRTPYGRGWVYSRYLAPA